MSMNPSTAGGSEQRAATGPSILVVGYNAWDLLFPLDATPPPDTKTEVPLIVGAGGGPGATAAVAMTRLGARVRLATVLSDDMPGIQQRADLLGAGVDLSLAQNGISPQWS